jgi:predicted Fe-Mo cluster-binding NifX family protein
MKICIPSQDGRGLESDVHGHFGSAPWFTFVDTGTGDIDAVENPTCQASPGSCHHVGMLSRRGIDAVVSTGIGRRALAGLADAGIRVLVAPERKVAAVVELAKADRLAEFELDAACAGGFQHGRGQAHRHGHGHGHAHGRGLGRGRGEGDHED